MEFLKKVLSGQSLNFEEARTLLKRIHDDCYSDDQLASILRAMRDRGETVEEIAGFASLMRERAIPVASKAKVIVDTAGTGGDGLQTFNISTAAALVIAGAGIAVAKHGNRGVSSRTGSADVMQALGVEVDLAPEAAERCLNEIGIAFCFAPRFHRATARVAKIRRELGGRTIFNFLGPLTNPAKVKHQIIGVCERSMTQTMAQVCRRLGSEHVWVVSSEEGADELSVSTLTYVCEFRAGEIRDFEILPEEYGFARGEIQDLTGGEAQENAHILKQVLLGEDQSARRDTVILNAAAGIYVAEGDSFESAIRRAQDSLDDGAAYDKLQQLIETTQNLKSQSTTEAK